MEIRVRRFQVTKRHALTISRGTSAGSENLLVEVTQEGVTGIGEMAPTSGGAFAETAATAAEAMEEWASLFTALSPWEFQRIEAILAERSGFHANHAARAALDMALYDWQGKKLGVPLWRLFGLDRNRIPITSVTIGINPPDVVREIVPEILARTGARALKVKLGAPAGIEADQAMFAAAQAAARGPISWRVDANGGWSVADALTMLPWLEARRVEFVEQPLLRGQELELTALHHESPLPLFADESVYLATDIPPIADRIDGVNLKLMKCGGLREALRIVHTARAHGLMLMIGCMSETSLAITAAAHLSPLVDYLDLDSHLNLMPDPHLGALLLEGRVVPTDAPGLGVTVRADA